MLMKTNWWINQRLNWILFVALSEQRREPGNIITPHVTYKDTFSMECLFNFHFTSKHPKAFRTIRQNNHLYGRIGHRHVIPHTFWFKETLKLTLFHLLAPVSTAQPILNDGRYDISTEVKPKHLGSHDWCTVVQLIHRSQSPLPLLIAWTWIKPSK